MAKEARFVWYRYSGGAEEMRFVADGEYILSVQQISLEITRYLKLCAVLANDAEYKLWRELYPTKPFIPAFAPTNGAVVWGELFVVWVLPLHEYLGQIEKEIKLVDYYQAFLRVAQIDHVPIRLPSVQWRETA